MAILGAIPARHDFYIRQGCGLGPYRLEITDGNDAPRDITDWTLEGSLRRSSKSSSVLAEVQSELIDDAVGAMRFWIAPEDTFLDCGESELDIASLYWLDIDLITASSTRIPIISGQVRVKAKGDLEETPEETP